MNSPRVRSLESVAVRDRPILFSAPMVRALLAGTKTQTRRLVKTVPSCRDADRAMPALMVRRGEHKGSYVLLDDAIGPAWSPAGGMPLERYPWDAALSPYGGIQDRLWVKETWHPSDSGPELFAADYASKAEAGVERWRSPLHMRRVDSRITLEVLAVRVERLKDISEADAIAEGIDPAAPMKARINGEPGDVHFFGPDAARKGYAMLWDAINGEGSWASNPWVWVVAFGRIKP